MGWAQCRWLVGAAAITRMGRVRVAVSGQHRVFRVTFFVQTFNTRKWLLLYDAQQRALSQVLKLTAVRQARRPMRYAIRLACSDCQNDVAARKIANVIVLSMLSCGRPHRLP